jgi:hypothetical protein
MSGVEQELARALAHLEAGQWQSAHEIVQEHEEHPVANWMHAIVHRLEGDLDNARYWYRRSGRASAEPLPLDQELPQIRAALQSRAG